MNSANIFTLSLSRVPRKAKIARLNYFSKRWNSTETNTEDQQPIQEFDPTSLNNITKRLKSLPRYSISNKTRAAVLIPLCYHNNEPSVLFTLRSQTVGTHKGQVSFPGGMKDEEDKDMTECALRETFEEIGVDPKQVTVLGSFHDAPSKTDVAVTPIVGFLGNIDIPSMAPSPKEIETIFTLSLKQLTDPDRIKFEWISTRGMLPIFQGVQEANPVWGLTAYILHNFMKTILRVPLPPIPKPTK